MSAFLDSSMQNSISWDDFQVQTRCRTSVAAHSANDGNDSISSSNALSLQQTPSCSTSPKRTSLFGESASSLNGGSNHQTNRLSRQLSLSSSTSPSVSNSRCGVRRYLEKQRSARFGGATVTMGRIDKSGKFVPAKRLK